MIGFNIDESLRSIEHVFKRYYATAKIELTQELTAPGYKDIIDSIFIAEDFSEVRITFAQGVEIETQQDVIEVLCQGGVIPKTTKEGKTFINVEPSPVVRKYLGKR